MPSTAPHVQLLQASVDSESESEFRILVDRKCVKYLIIDPGLYDADGMCFEPSLISLLPTLPSGNWNWGRISYSNAEKRPCFAEAIKAELPGVKNLWHPVQIEYLELQLGQKLRSNVYEATCSQFTSTIVAKFARFPWEIPQLDDETSAYQRIKDAQIGPKFLGHLSEDGRVIGFIMERITEFRHATPDDLPLCQRILLKLHKLGIKHGDLNKHNFLIHHGEATLIDLDTSTWCSNTKALNEEYQSLLAELRDTSGRGGRKVEGNVEELML